MTIIEPPVNSASALPKLSTVDPADLPWEEDCAEFYSRYEPREVLGRGLVSVVRKCVERATGDIFAVKIIDIGTDEGKKIVDETKREIVILQAMRGDENVILLHESFETVSFIFLVLEFCPQGELFDYMTRVVTVSSKKTRQIMHRLLSVIANMHSKFIVHRDIKPENILLDENMNIKVSDFGFATFVSERDGDTELRELMGTPAYLSPEVLKCSMNIDNRGYGRPTDVWACGVVMYTLMSGRPPFWHRRQVMMLRMIMEARYDFLSPEWEDVSNSAKELIRRMLEVDPSKRITASEALQHEFFVTFNPSEVDYEAKPFNARQKLRATAFLVLSIVRLKLQVVQKPVTTELLCKAPYNSKVVRKMIDSCAFRIYGHWVKRGDHQNRAALFENSIKTACTSHMSTPS